jgi:hypothetical protein
MKELSTAAGDSGANDGKWHESNISGPLNGGRYFPLMLGTVTGDPSREDLASFSDKMTQRFNVFVIDLHAAVRAEDTDFASLERSFLL